MQRKICVDDIVTNHLQEILNRKHIQLEDFVKYAVNQGLSRALVYRIAANPHYGMKEDTSHKLQVLLNVSHDELITWCPSVDALRDDPRGFTQDCLKKLSEKMVAIGIELNYQVYSQNHAMNVTTRYAQNRRMYLDGNFRIYTRGLPELDLINFDVINNRIDTSAEELKSFHMMLLQRVVNFAKEIGIYKVRYYVFQYNFEERLCVSPKQNMEICKKLGFEISSKYNTTDYQTCFVKTITHPNIFPDVF